MGEERRLTYKQRRFCEEYIVDGNASQAGLRAGYSSGGIAQTAHNLLRLTDVVDYIDELKAKQQERTQITADKVLGELYKMAFSDIRELFSETETGGTTLKSPLDLDEATAKAVQSIEVVTANVGTKDEPEIEYTHKIKMVDKKSSAELLGKYLKLFSDRLSVEVPEGVNFNMSFGADKKDQE